jgi:hypothetical protein
MKDLLERLISIMEAHFDKIMEIFASGGNSQNLTSTCSGNLNGLSLANLCYDILGNARPSMGDGRLELINMQWEARVAVEGVSLFVNGAFGLSLTAASTGSRRRIHR